MLMNVFCQHKTFFLLNILESFDKYPGDRCHNFYHKLLKYNTKNQYKA